MFDVRKLYELLKDVDPDVKGSVFEETVDGVVRLTGRLESSTVTPQVFEELAGECCDQLFQSTVVLTEPSTELVVGSRTSKSFITEPDGEGEVILDRVRVLHYGLIPLDMIDCDDEYKIDNPDLLRSVEACVGVLGFIQPIILDRNLSVIDGKMRVSIARRLLKDDPDTRPSVVPVVVLDVDDARADFLRLVMNRSSEFQRWDYDHVDAYVDAHPQLQPLLEPLGLFSERVLPVSFFGKSVVNYTIDEYNDQQKEYSQEIGLATWAEIQRERIAEKNKARERSRVNKHSTKLESLFDMEWSESDLLESYPIKEAMREHELLSRGEAETITQNYDAQRRQEKEAKGQAWQTTRRSTKQKVADKRRESEEGAKTDAVEEG